MGAERGRQAEPLVRAIRATVRGNQAIPADRGSSLDRIDRMPPGLDAEILFILFILSKLHFIREIREIRGDIFAKLCNSDGLQGTQREGLMTFLPCLSV